MKQLLVAFAVLVGAAPLSDAFAGAAPTAPVGSHSADRTEGDVLHATHSERALLMMKPSGQASIQGKATTRQEQPLPGASFLAIGARTKETTKQKQPVEGMRTVMHRKQAGTGYMDEGPPPLHQMDKLVHMMHQAGVSHHQQPLQEREASYNANDEHGPIVESVIVPHPRNKEHRRHTDHISAPSHLRKVEEENSEEETQQPPLAVSGNEVAFEGEPIENQSPFASTATTVDEDGPPGTPLEYWAKYPSTMASFYMVYVVFVVMVAYLYNQLYMQSDPRKTSIPLQDETHGDGWFDQFTLGLFDVRYCDQDWPSCLMACFCPAISWAGTVSAEETPVLGFWAALSLVLVLNLLGPFTNGATCLLLIPLAVYFRQRLRSNGGGGAQTPKTLALDVFAWALCPCCALVQEARVAERGTPLATNRSQYLLPKPMPRALSTEESIADSGQVNSCNENTMVHKFAPAPANNAVKSDEALHAPEPDHRDD